jgi:hypothetical protein
MLNVQHYVLLVTVIVVCVAFPPETPELALQLEAHAVTAAAAAARVVTALCNTPSHRLTRTANGLDPQSRGHGRRATDDGESSLSGRRASFRVASSLRPPDGPGRLGRPGRIVGPGA